jgi:hypothetical protein
MTRLTRCMDNFWFPETPASRLAILRILIGAYTLWYLVPRYSMFVEIGRTNPALFDPVGVVAFLDQPIPVLAFQILVIATLACNVFFILGWKYRYSGPAFALLLLGVLCYRNSWSMIYHSDNVLVLHALILGLTYAADTFSLDAFMRSRSASRAESASGTARGRRSGESWQYGWPIQLMCAVTVITYFLAGVAKVAGPLGWSWGSGEALRSQIAVDAMRKELLGSAAPPWLLLFMTRCCSSPS